MPKFDVRISVEQRGAIFDASKSRAAGQRMVTNINETLAQEGVHRVRQRLGQVLQNPTGYYESKITIDRKATNRAVWDSGVVYGGWLEGIDPRNSTSRFKGYATFRRVSQDMERESAKLAQPAVDKFVNEMNG